MNAKDFIPREMHFCPSCGEKVGLTEPEPKPDLFKKALDPEWQRVHKEMGFASPIADLFDTGWLHFKDEGEEDEEEE